ncbi:HigA family addiction module antitoxin [Crenobacter sp. SG2303]|uniref:HigA family addiction module antitoxin n=1 Tax=Crenobacter oryzisoli TaxID=3056844 RepID=A0ABT7XMT7_9NEIS|nr:HigA family addiction module antitoxin [Crenobacter sp. SG2303]MDN0075104.1 HigA family addiction module antitoxin [Crenobacter sp. SG2303]
MAIQDFNDKETAKIWSGTMSLRLPADIQRKARMKLRMLNAAHELADLRIPPANRLEALKGDRAGQHSIRSMTNGACVSAGETATLTTWKSSMTTEAEEQTMDKLPNIHPGEVLNEEFLVPLRLSQNALARAMHVPPRRINEIVHGQRAITADTALRLSRVLGTTAQFWMALQTDYDLEVAASATDLTELIPLAA